MMLAARLSCLSALFALLGCGTRYEAALRLTIRGADSAALGSGGGYVVALTRADGEPLARVDGTFVEFQPGNQDVTLVLQDEAHFDSAKKLRARVRVEAVSSRDGVPTAIGVTFVTLALGEVVEATVALEPDPRPLSGELTARFGSVNTALDGARVDLAWDDLVLPDGRELHAGLMWSDGAYRWLGLLEAVHTGSATFAAAVTSPLYWDDGVQVVISAESMGSDQPLLSPGEWIVFRGALHPQVRSALLPVLGPEGQIGDVMALYQPAFDHCTFARGAIPNVADTRAHAEHVFTTVSGASGTNAGDLNGDGTEEFIVTDTAGMPAHLQAARLAIQGLAENSPDGLARVADGVTASTCVSDAITQIGVVKSQAQALAADPINVTTADQLITAMRSVWGLPFGAGTPQTLECFIDRAEAHAVFALPAVPHGTR